jgi:hypothetical protein
MTCDTKGCTREGTPSAVRGSRCQPTRWAGAHCALLTALWGPPSRCRGQGHAYGPGAASLPRLQSMGLHLHGMRVPGRCAGHSQCLPAGKLLGGVAAVCTKILEIPYYTARPLNTRVAPATVARASWQPQPQGSAGCSPGRGRRFGRPR